MNQCPLGILDCDESLENSCKNYPACRLWAAPWPLPYEYDFEKSELIIKLFIKHKFTFQQEIDISSFEDLDFSLSQEWLDWGFNEAIPLPYVYSEKKKILSVWQDLLDFRKPCRLPYQIEELEDGCQALVVRAIPEAYSAGWCEACACLDLLPF